MGSVQKFVGLIPDLNPSHWNLSQTIPNLPIIYITTPAQDMGRVAEILIALIAVGIAIGTSGTSDSSEICGAYPRFMLISLEFVSNNSKLSDYLFYDSDSGYERGGRDCDRTDSD